MKKEISLETRKIEYNLERKRVKNINLRIKSDGTVHVSANTRVPTEVIERFMHEKSVFITRALDKYAARQAKTLHEYFSEAELRSFVLDFLNTVYPYFESRGVLYPQIRFRRMTSRWGSCIPSKQVVTFNTNLVCAPPECVEYVVLHELVHFLQANHSAAFYAELKQICPDYKVCQNKLRSICIHR